MDSDWAPKSPSFYVPDEAVPLHPQHQGYRGSVSHIPPPFTSSSPSQPREAAPFPDPHSMVRGGTRKESMQDGDYMPDAPPMEIGQLAVDNGKSVGSSLPPNVNDIVIKNHFPVARIKRIMQADDDVGKVAQVTPVVVCT